MPRQRQQERTHAAIVDQLLASLADAIGERRPLRQSWRQHSNDVGRLDFGGSRTLMVKVGRFAWAMQRFAAERRAAALLAAHGLLVPEHLDAPALIDGRPVLCYWRIKHATLATAWPRLSPDRRRQALRGWGDLLHHVHATRLSRCGPLAWDGTAGELSDFLEADLAHRLLPALAATWPAGLPPLERALRTLPQLSERIDSAAIVLLHGDPHARNVLCRSAATRVVCEGVIDLEAAAGGPRELDLAHALVLHGPLFDQPLPHGWFDELRAGYRAPLDDYALEWFALYHLLNLGFFSAHVGDHAHAATVARAARRSGRF